MHRTLLTELRRETSLGWLSTAVSATASAARVPHVIQRTASDERLAQTVARGATTHPLITQQERPLQDAKRDEIIARGKATKTWRRIVDPDSDSDAPPSSHSGTKRRE